MKVSIVTISFNQAEFLERTLRSVIGQRETGVDVEYIVVDPGSTDGSRAIIEHYRDQIDVVLLDRDSGPADGLNKGFAHANGDVFGYLNSDDILLPGALAQTVSYLERHRTVDVVSGHAWIIGPDDECLRRTWSDPFRSTWWAYGASVQIQPSTFFRRAAFERSGGFNPANRVGWDAELMMDMHLTGARFARLDAFLSGYRLHRDSITNSGAHWDEMVEGWHRTFQKAMHRRPNRFDWWATRGFAVLKHLTSPRATLERIRRGPVANRGVE